MGDLEGTIQCQDFHANFQVMKFQDPRSKIHPGGFFWKMELKYHNKPREAESTTAQIIHVYIIYTCASCRLAKKSRDCWERSCSEWIT